VNVNKNQKRDLAKKYVEGYVLKHKIYAMWPKRPNMEIEMRVEELCDRWSKEREWMCD